MQLDKEIEQKIKEEAIKFLSVGRTNWDVRHTLETVDWMKILITTEGGNERILVPVMYFHDTGYEELSKGYGHEEVLAAKHGHGERGAKHVREILPTLDYFSSEEIDRIAYLVLNHDIHNNVTETDRQLVLEADGLGQIDWENCPPSYDRENCFKFLTTTFQHDRINFVKTETGIKLYAALTQKAFAYLENPDNFPQVWFQ